MSMQAQEQILTLTTYHGEPIYRGVTSDGDIVYVDPDTLEMNRDLPVDELFSADGWADSVDEECVWKAACCQECGAEFRPIDGHVAPPFYAYCDPCNYS